MKNNIFDNKYLLLSLLFSNNVLCPIKFNSNDSTLALDQTNSSLTLLTSLPITAGTLKLRTTPGTTDTNINSATGAETISFANASLELDSNLTGLTGGTYDPKTSARDVLTLSTGNIMSVSAGTTLYNDVAVASGATATILGTPTFVSSVSLGNSSSVLNLGIQNKLNKDIVLNGGKLVLQDNLELADGVRIWGSGTVDINYQSLRFGSQVNSSVFSQDLTFWRAKDITLNGPVTLAGNWSFLTNSTDNESVINGNGNILTLNGGNLVVGDATSGHTLYISDCHIKGIGLVNLYTVGGLSQSTYTSGKTGLELTYGNAAYGAGFSVVTNNNSSASDVLPGACVYDDSAMTAPSLYCKTVIGYTVKYVLNTSPSGFFFTEAGSEVQASIIDVGTDRTFLWQEGSYGGPNSIYLYNGSSSTIIRTTTNYSGNYQAISIGSLNYIYAVKYGDKTAIAKYLGSVNSWNDSWGTGYTNILCICASNDGYVWVLDKTGASTYTLTKTNGGTKATGTAITLPEAPSTLNSVLGWGTIESIGALSFKGSSTTPFLAYCGASGTIYTSTDGLTLTTVGNFGAVSVAIGAKGTLMFSGIGRAPFVKPAGSNNFFNLYDGGATDANRGKVVLSNVTLELAGNYTHSAGRITFKGDNCKIITGGTKTVTLSSTNAPFEVDSVTLTYDTLAGTNSYPFTGAAVTLTNGGVVRSAIATGDLIIDGNLYNGTSAPTLTQNYSLSAGTGKISVTNPAGTASQTVTINGGNYFWDFPGGTVTGLAIADKVTVTLTNVILKNFSLSNVSFGGANAALVFGDGCIIELGSDQSLTTGQGAWLFSGNATIRGMGQTITLNNADSIRQSVANKTLTIANANLRSLNTGSLSCVSLGTVSLTNSTLQINTGGFTWSAGNLDINGYSKLASMNLTTSGGSSNFNLTTSGQMTVRSGSTLELGRAINFAYSPTTTGDTGGATGTVAKRHFALGSSGDASATLYANNCSIDSTAVGMALDRGNFVVENKVVITASSSANAESELGSALNVEILSSGVLRLDGGVKYTVTTV